MSACETFTKTVLATITGLNAKTVAQTSFSFTVAVPTGYRFVITDIFIRSTAFTSGGKSTDAVASVGGNSATYDDFINSETIDIDASIEVVHLVVTGGANNHVSYAAGTDIRLAIEVGSNATTETWAVELFGYLVSA